MAEASVRELRNHGGEVLDRVAAGEYVTVTSDGKPVAELRPLPQRGLTAVALVERFSRLPPVDPQRLRADVDAVMNPVTRTMVGVIDTNTLILLEHLDPDTLPEEPVISAITLAELSAGPLVAVDEHERAARQARLQEAEAVFEPLSFDASAARAFGQVASSLCRSGRKPAARALDALIAAAAIANGLALYTCNPKNYTGIDDLTLIAIPHPDAT